MTNDIGFFFALIAVLTFIAAIVGVGLYIWGSLAMMALFKKAQHPQPWAAWVPFYRDFVFYEIGGQTGWFMFLNLGATFTTATMADLVGARWGLTVVAALLVTAASLVFWIFAVGNINRAMQKPLIGFTILGALLPLVWLSFVAWDRSSFNPALATGPKAPGKGDTFLEMAQRAQDSETDTAATLSDADR